MQRYNRKSKTPLEDVDGFLSVTSVRSIGIKSRRNTERVNAKNLLYYISKLELRQAPPMELLRLEAMRFYNRDFLSEKALCAYLRHRYTNYSDLIYSASGNIHGGSLYENFKVYLCYLIVKHYDLKIDPRIAAFNQDRYPKRFRVGPDETVDQMILRLIQPMVG